MPKRPRHHPRKCPSVPPLGRLRGLGRARASEPVYDAPTVRELLDRLPGGPWPWAAGAGVAALWVLFRNRPVAGKELEPGENLWTWPLEWPFTLSSGFGWRDAVQLDNGEILPASNHQGQDLIVPGGTEGEPVYAAQAGKVTRVGHEVGSGNDIYIDHGGGWSSRYYHLQHQDVAVGDQVETGQFIGRAGRTGTWVKGAHLHFEIRVNGTAVNPVFYLPEGYGGR